MNKLIQLAIAVLVSAIILPLGMLYNIYNSLKNIFSFKNGIVKFFSYWLIIIKQLFVVFNFLLQSLAISLDYLWNAFSGELFEKILTEKKNTYYGKGDITISAATGQLERYRNLNENGIRFSSMLNKFFKQKDHCLSAWYRYLYLRKVK